MKTPMQVVDGAQFNPIIPAPGPIVPPAEKKKRELRDDYLTMLCSLRPNTAKDSLEEHALIAWVVARIELNKEADALLETLQQLAAQALLEEGELSKAAVREQQQFIAEFKKDTGVLQVELNRLSHARGQLQADFDSAQLRKKNSRAMPRGANGAVVVAERELSIASERAGNIQAQINARNLEGL